MIRHREGSFPRNGDSCKRGVTGRPPCLCRVRCPSARSAVKRIHQAALIVLCLTLPGVAAGASTITDALAWLVAAQDATGLWGGSKQTPIRDATAVVEALHRAAGGESALGLGVEAIGNTKTSSADYLARKIIALSTTTTVSRYLLDSLLQMQNADGGWGLYSGYASSPLETALALKSLLVYGKAAPEPVSAAVTYLTIEQNGDGGWPVTPGDTSTVFATSRVILALQLVPGSESVDNAIAAGVNWLASQPNPDGGFGVGGVSSAAETGFALAAIAPVDSGSASAVDARLYLESTQEVDGSWEGDAYATAAALLGIVSHLMVQTQQIDVLPGLNLLGLPLAPLDTVTTIDLLGQIPGTSEITGWDASGQSWVTNSFAVAQGDAFVVNASSKTRMATLGHPWIGTQCEEFEQGLNLVSLTGEDLCYTGAGLLSDFTDCDEVHSWDAQHQRWRSVIEMIGGGALGDDFSITPGMGVFVRVEAPGEWCTSPCEYPGMSSGQGQDPSVQPFPLVSLEGLETTRISERFPIIASAAQTVGARLTTSSVEIADVMVVNVSSSSVTISWRTDSTTNGCVRYGILTAGELARCHGPDSNTLHRVVLDNLEADTTYVFEVVSGNAVDSNGGDLYSFRTARVGAGQPSILYGRVIDVDSAPAVGAHVAVTVSHAGGASSCRLIAVSDTLGRWHINLGNLKDSVTLDVFEYSAADSILLSVKSTSGGTATASTTWSGNSPAYTSDMVLVPPCQCPYQADADASGFTDATDLQLAIDAVFFGGGNPQDAWCPTHRLDFDCNGFTDALDLQLMIDYVFFGGGQPCDPCLQ